MDNRLWIRVWNVGKGNAVSLRLPSNKLVMIDAGASDDCSPVTTLKNKFGFANVNTLVITHPHTDHMVDLKTMQELGMGPTVLIRPKWISQKAVLDGNNDKESANYYLAVNEKYNGDVPRENDVYSSTVTGGVIFKKYMTNALSEGNLNNASIVHLVEYFGVKVLFPGDCTAAAMRDLLDKTTLKEDIKGLKVLVAPHHGHESCYCSELMEIISPSVCIVSEGHGGEDGNYVDSRYSNEDRVRGFRVAKRNGTRELRRCITTRTDGNIDLFVNADGLDIATEN